MAKPLGRAGKTMEYFESREGQSRFFKVFLTFFPSPNIKLILTQYGMLCHDFHQTI
jgi:hypothetical protein